MAWIVDPRSMRHYVRLGLVVVGCGFFSVFSAFAAESTVVVPAGFSASDVLSYDPANGGVGGLAFTPDGDLIVHEGGVVKILRADGVEPLTTFDPPVFGSFLAVTPDGDSLLVGESTDNNIYRLPLAGGDRVLVDNIRFNYSIAIDAQGNGFVSAPNADFTLNQILLIDGDPNTLSPPIVSDLPGFSGPVALDAEGNLYYGTATIDCEETLFRFSQSQLEEALAGTPLSVSEAETLLSDAVGFTHMTFAQGTLFFSELGFCTDPGVGRVWTVDVANNFLLEAHSEFPAPDRVVSPSFLAFHPGSKLFAPGVGPDGGSFVVSSSDFSAIGKVTEIVPQFFFVRGRINDDLRVDVSDAISLLNYLFGGEPPPEPLAAGDVNNDDRVNISDALFLLNFLFGSGPVIPAPFPEPGPVR